MKTCIQSVFVCTILWEFWQENCDFAWVKNINAKQRYNRKISKTKQKKNNVWAMICFFVAYIVNTIENIFF